MEDSTVDRRVLDALTASGRPFEVIHCDPELADTAEFCEHYGYPLEKSANTILVASKRPPGHFAACVVLATTRLDVNRKVKELLGVRKLSFAPPEVTREVTGMMIGGVTAFALPPELPLWVDGRVMEADWIILGSGSRSSKIKTAPDVLLSLPGAEVIEDLALPVATGPSDRAAAEERHVSD